MPQKHFKHKVRIYNWKDVANLATHGLGLLATLGGIAVVTASPVLTGVAIGVSAIVCFPLRNWIVSKVKGKLPVTSETDLPPASRHVSRFIRGFSLLLGMHSDVVLHALTDASQCHVHIGVKRGRNLLTKSEEWLEHKINALTDKFTDLVKAAPISTKRDGDGVVATKAFFESLDPPEEHLVSAHALGHMAARHDVIKSSMAFLGLSAKLNGSLFFLMTLGAASPEIYSAYAAVQIIAVAVGLLLRSYARRCEFQADRIAAEGTRNPKALRSALCKIRNYNLLVEPKLVWLDYKKGSLILKPVKMALTLYKSQPHDDRRDGRLRLIEQRFHAQALTEHL
jgi:Zn-dependent protease with chaperone function